MGGLVVRSACHYGSHQERGWPDAVRHIVCLGSPQLGADVVYHFVATTAGPRPVGAILGDHLVRSKSASGVGRFRQVPFEPAHGLTLTGLHHFDLLNHAAIYAKLHEWLSQSGQQTESAS